MDNLITFLENSYLILLPGLSVFGAYIFYLQIKDIFSSTPKHPVTGLNYLLAALAAITFILGSTLSIHHYWYDIKCPKCEQSLDVSKVFCPNCGTQNPNIKICSKCYYATSSETVNYCPKCGNELKK